MWLSPVWIPKQPSSRVFAIQLSTTPSPYFIIACNLGVTDVEFGELNGRFQLHPIHSPVGVGVREPPFVGIDGTDTNANLEIAFHPLKLVESSSFSESALARLIL